jgi:hypothetical protein
LRAGRSVRQINSAAFTCGLARDGPTACLTRAASCWPSDEIRRSSASVAGSKRPNRSGETLDPIPPPSLSLHSLSDAGDRRLEEGARGQRAAGDSRRAPPRRRPSPPLLSSPRRRKAVDAGRPSPRGRRPAGDGELHHGGCRPLHSLALCSVLLFHSPVDGDTHLWPLLPAMATPGTSARTPAAGWRALCPRRESFPFGGSEGEAPTARVLCLDASACRCASRSRGTCAALRRRIFSGEPEGQPVSFFSPSVTFGLGFLG